MTRVWVSLPSTYSFNGKIPDRTASRPISTVSLGSKPTGRAGRQRVNETRSRDGECALKFLREIERLCADCERRGETARSCPVWKCLSPWSSSPQSSLDQSHLRRLLPGGYAHVAPSSSPVQLVPRPERPLSDPLPSFDRVGAAAAMQRLRSFAVSP
jgi:hypothetical protein